MASAETQTVYVKSGDGAPREGILNFQRFTASDRMGRAVKVLAGFWLAAAVTAFIPIAHFVLVPALFLAGPVMAFLRYRVDTASENVTVRCPACDQEVTIPLEPSDKLPMYAYCPHCNQSLHLAEK